MNRRAFLLSAAAALAVPPSNDIEVDALIAEMLDEGFRELTKTLTLLAAYGVIVTFKPPVPARSTLALPPA